MHRSSQYFQKRKHKCSGIPCASCRAKMGEEIKKAKQLALVFLLLAIVPATLAVDCAQGFDELSLQLAWFNQPEFAGWQVPNSRDPRAPKYSDECPWGGSGEVRYDIASPYRGAQSTSEHHLGPLGPFGSIGPIWAHFAHLGPLGPLGPYRPIGPIGPIHILQFCCLHPIFNSPQISI